MVTVMLRGDRLKKLRMSMGVTQEDLGNILKVTKSTICCYERGTRTPTLENLIDLSDYFQVSIDYLLGRDVLVRNKNNTLEFMSEEDLNLMQRKKSLKKGESMKIEDIISKFEKSKKLSKEEIEYVVTNYTNGLIDDDNMSKLLLLIKEYGLSYKETFYLTDSMIKTGDVLDLGNIKRTVVDKHSTGGVGDKVTFLVAPIVASLGLGVAKMSGRSLGFTGGTIDKLESIPGYKVKITNEEFENNVNNVGISVISQTSSLAPADKKIYALRDQIGAVESIPLIASSIMSKKIASGAKYIVIDLKVGKGAFMKDIESAKVLGEYMIKIGEYFNRKVVCLLTDMNTPLGFSIGNSLEVKEAQEFFSGKREKRIEKLVIVLASEMVSIGKGISIEEAETEVKEVLENGMARDKFYEWITNQGGSLSKIRDSKYQRIIYSNSEGYINEIDPIKLAMFVKDLGAGRVKKEDNIDLTVGVTLKHSLYDYVKEGTPLVEIFYNKEIPDMEERILESFKIESIKTEEKDIIISVLK